MDVFQLARKPAQGLRIILAALLLAFVLDSMAHASHQHDAGAPSTHAVHCGYCAAFTGAADGPARSAVGLLRLVDDHPVFAGHTVLLGTRPTTSARPRAPPVS